MHLTTVSITLSLTTMAKETFDNTIHSPAEDGGGTIRKTTSNFGRPEFSARCANAPQTFLNDGSCILSDNVDVCGIDSDYKDIEGPSSSFPLTMVPFEQFTALLALGQRELSICMLSMVSELRTIFRFLRLVRSFKLPAGHQSLVLLLHQPPSRQKQRQFLLI